MDTSRGLQPPEEGAGGTRREVGAGNVSQGGAAGAENGLRASLSWWSGTWWTICSARRDFSVPGADFAAHSRSSLIRGLKPPASVRRPFGPEDGRDFWQPLRSLIKWGPPFVIRTPSALA